MFFIRNYFVATFFLNILSCHSRYLTASCSIKTCFLQPSNHNSSDYFKKIIERSMNRIFCFESMVTRINLMINACIHLRKIDNCFTSKTLIEYLLVVSFIKAYTNTWSFCNRGHNFSTKVG